MNLLNKFSTIKQVSVFDTLCEKDKEALLLIKKDFDSEMAYLNATYKHLTDIPDLSKMAYCEKRNVKSYNSFKTIIAEAIENAKKTIAAAKKNFINNVINYFETNYLIKTPIPEIKNHSYTNNPITKTYLALLENPEIETILVFIQSQNNGLSFFEKGMRNIIDTAKNGIYRKGNVVLKGNKIEFLNRARYNDNYGTGNFRIKNDCNSRKIMAALFVWEFRSFGIAKPCENDKESILADSYDSGFVNFQYDYQLTPHEKALSLNYYKNGKFVITFDSKESAYAFYNFCEFDTLQEGKW